MLRRPTNIDIDLLRPTHPTLAVVSHEFTKREPNGLPEPDYNESLFEMDTELVRAFDVDQTGVPVLVETYGGKRLLLRDSGHRRSSDHFRSCAPIPCGAIVVDSASRPRVGISGKVCERPFLKGLIAKEFRKREARGRVSTSGWVIAPAWRARRE
jgi:hypothetical protein